MENRYNSNYKIALYKLSATYSKMIKDYFINYSNTFEIIEIDNLEIDNSELTNQPDLLLIDLNENITEEMQNYSKKNFTQIVKVTNLNHDLVDHNEMVLSLTSDIRKRKILSSQKEEFITYFQYSMEVLKNISQLSNTSKLQYLSRELLTGEKDKIIAFDNQKQVLDILNKLNYFISLKDSYTKVHSDHVSDYAVMLGKELNLTDSELELIKIGGELHDIGKVGIPDAIIRKTTSLSDEEFEIMKRHTVIGDTLLPNEDTYKQIKEMIRGHHEKMDGTGYPDGLKGDEIPYFARILSICDTFDAMTTQRTYNKTKTLEEAFDELRNSSMLKVNDYGIISQQLDPKLVESFISAIKKNELLMNEFNKRDNEILGFRNNQEVKLSV